MSLQRLDNRFPPTYDRVSPEKGDPYADPSTMVRAIQGHDVWHYTVDQRVAGDLMYRDLILLQNQQYLKAAISLRPAIEINCPMVTVRPGVPVKVGGFQIPQDSSGVLVMAETMVKALYSAVAEADLDKYQLVIKNRASGAQVSASGADTPSAPDTWVLPTYEAYMSSGVSISRMAPGRYDVLLYNTDDSGSPPVSMGCSLTIGLVGAVASIDLDSPDLTIGGTMTPDITSYRLYEVKDRPSIPIGSVARVSSSDYTVVVDTADKNLDAGSSPSLAKVTDVLATLISTLQDRKVI